MPRTITMLTFTCARCGVEFTRRKQDVHPTRRAKPMYCSRKCASQARDPATRSGNPLGMRAMPGFASSLVTLTCEWCKAEFQRKPSEAGYYALHFCNRVCRAAHMASGTSEGKRKPSLPPRICEGCGASFYVTPSRVRQGWGKFCSRACANDGQRNALQRICVICGTAFTTTPAYNATCCSRPCAGKLRGQRRVGIVFSPEWRANMAMARQGVPNLKRRKPPVRLTCLQCGQVAIRPGTRTAATFERQFCSRECWFTYIRTAPDHNANYRGGYPKYYGPNWSAQKRAARKRDNDTCQHCGLQRHQPALDVHHIRPFRAFQGDWQQANQLDNLTTLCRVCHSHADNPKTSPLSLAKQAKNSH